MERSAGSGASSSALRGRLPDLGGAAWGDLGAWSSAGAGGPARVLSPIGLGQQHLVRWQIGLTRTV